MGYTPATFLHTQDHKEDEDQMVPQGNTLRATYLHTQWTTRRRITYLSVLSEGN